MSSLTDAYLVAHAAEIRLTMALFAVVASVATVSLAVSLEDAAKSLRTRFAQSESGRLAAVSAH